MIETKTQGNYFPVSWRQHLFSLKNFCLPFSSVRWGKTTWYIFLSFPFNSKLKSAAETPPFCPWFMLDTSTTLNEELPSAATLGSWGATQTGRLTNRRSQKETIDDLAYIDFATMECNFCKGWRFCCQCRKVDMVAALKKNLFPFFSLFPFVCLSLFGHFFKPVAICCNLTLRPLMVC